MENLKKVALSAVLFAITALSDFNITLTIILTVSLLFIWLPVIQYIGPIFLNLMHSISLLLRNISRFITIIVNKIIKFIKSIFALINSIFKTIGTIINYFINNIKLLIHTCIVYIKNYWHIIGMIILILISIAIVYFKVSQKIFK
jgi:hypothetical protein